MGTPKGKSGFRTVCVPHDEFKHPPSFPFSSDVLGVGWTLYLDIQAGSGSPAGLGNGQRKGEDYLLLAQDLGSRNLSQKLPPRLTSFLTDHNWVTCPRPEHLRAREWDSLADSAKRLLSQCWGWVSVIWDPLEKARDPDTSGVLLGRKRWAMDKQRAVSIELPSSESSWW